MDLLEAFQATLGENEANTASDVAEYVEWMVGRQNDPFTPSKDDEVALRAYLLHLRIQGTGRKRQRRHIASLRRFYEWAAGSDLIPENPIAGREFDQPLLRRKEIRRRRERLPIDKSQRELAQLRGLNDLAQALIRSVDIEAALNVTLSTLTRLMDVETAWIFLLPEVYRQLVNASVNPAHDFALAASCQLPPGLEDNKHFFLCQPPDCHCQSLAREGRLQRALNIVECTRMQDAAQAHGDVRGLFFHASAPLFASDQLLGIVNVATSNWQLFTAADLQLLSIVGAYVSAALERANLYDLTRIQRERFEEELEMARQVQASLLPHLLPEIPGFEIAAHWHSAREVSGDFYDVFPLADGRFGLVIADVSDKGAPAALYMAMTRSLIRANAEQYEGPAETLRKVNEDVMASSTSDMFVTLFYGILDPATAALVYASAGHDPPILGGRTSGEIEWLMPTGPLIGVYEELPIEEKRLALAAGERVLFYTDGAPDALNEAGKEYGRARLASHMAQEAAGAQACMVHIHQDIEGFVGEAAPMDDITLMVLARV